MENNINNETTTDLPFKEIASKIEAQKLHFQKNKKTSVQYRKSLLRKLSQNIINNLEGINNALYTDFHKSEAEALNSEVLLVQTEIKHVLRKLSKWAKPEKKAEQLLTFPSKNYVISEPFGTCLIIGPWNYPFMLTIAPLVGAIAAGNTVILKPSELTEQTSKVICKIIKETFTPEEVTVIEGGIPETTFLLKQPFDKIFFTGSPAVGKIVMRAAAEHLIPVTLELGGKSPCIVTEKCDLEATAKRIVWGKIVNAGQTCIAPDYIVVHHRIKNAFVQKFKETIEDFYENIETQPKDFASIINHKNFDRINDLLTGEKIIFGGFKNRAQRYISPTLVETSNWQSPIMEEEIFGPVLPVLEYENIDIVLSEINKKPKPLALYIFSNSKKEQTHIMHNCQSGGVNINDVLMHIVNSNLPFGGIQNSGMGGYHGKYSFDCFSHKRAVQKKGIWLDIFFRYPPYTPQKLKISNFIVKWFS